MTANTAIEKIKALFEDLNATICTIKPTKTYPELAGVFIKLANAIHAYEGDNDDWIYIGEGYECSLSEMIPAAYWHYTQWHAGQESESYAALSALGQVYQPGFETEPDADDDSQTEQYFVFSELNKMAEEDQKASA